MDKPLAIIILAAGKGSRMKSDLPKVLQNVGSNSMITQVIMTAKSTKADKIITVLGYKHELVKKHINDNNIEIVLQLKQLGTAHAVLQCQEKLKNFEGNVMILYGDIPLISQKTLNDLIESHNKNNALSTILTTDLNQPKGYGRIIRNSDNSLKKIVEEKDATKLEKLVKEINSGIYIFNSKTLFLLLPRVNNHNKQQEYYLPDVINMLVNENNKVGIKKINNSNEIQGINNQEQLANVNRIKQNV